MSVWVTRVASASNPRDSHEVRVYDNERASCDCWKFKRTGSCHHQGPAIAAAQLATERPAYSLPPFWRPILGRADQEAWEMANSKTATKTTCDMCATPLEFNPEDRLLFCPNEDCDQFAVYPDLITCIDCGTVESASNPAQRCNDCQRHSMQQSYSIYFPKGPR